MIFDNNFKVIFLSINSGIAYTDKAYRILLYIIGIVYLTTCLQLVTRIKK